MEGVDLSGLKGQPAEVPILGEQAEAALTDAALRTGILCSACGQAMTGEGFEYIHLRAVQMNGQPTVKISRLFVCWRDECETARQMISQDATAIRKTIPWAVNFAEAAEEEPEAEADAGPDAD